MINIMKWLMMIFICTWISAGITNLLYTIYKYKDEGKFLSIGRILICIPIYIISGPISLKFNK